MRINRLKLLSTADIVRHVNAVLLMSMASFFLIVPGVTVMGDLFDANMAGPGISRRAWKLHRDLSRRYPSWARKRIQAGTANSLPLHDVPSTEWPMHGSVFYLWATEALQDAWDRDHSLSKIPPRQYAAEAIEAAKDIIVDPSHHAWVKTHWGDGYMHRENLFFRGMVITGLTSYVKLTGSVEHLELLRDQTESLAEEIDASPFGLLNDYPGECYPIDVVPAIAFIGKADEVLGTDHSAFTARAERAFRGELLDDLGLVPFRADAKTGLQLQPSRGVGNSHALAHAIDLWPEQANRWYSLYERHFWQKRLWAIGFREYAREKSDHDWGFEIDAGPIIGGFGVGASAFGIGMARKFGRLDHAYTLTAEALAVSWPLPDGTLLGPRVLSKGAHAPYLGEAGLLYMLTRTPVAGAELTRGGELGGIVFFALFFYLGFGGILFFSALWDLKRWRQCSDPVPRARLQLGLWLALILVTTQCFYHGHLIAGALAMLLALLLPRRKFSRDDTPVSRS